MPVRFFVIPLLAGLAWGAGERQAVERVVAEFAGSLPAPAGVWTERTRPRLQVEDVRFLGLDVALVDAAWIVYGSLVLKQTHARAAGVEKRGRRLARGRLPPLRMPVLAGRYP